MLDPADIFSEIAGGDLLDRAAFELIDPRRQRTAHRRRLVECDVDVSDLDSAIDATARVRRVERYLPIGDGVRVECGEALSAADHRRRSAKAPREYVADQRKRNYWEEMTHSGIVPADRRSLLCRLLGMVNAAGRRRCDTRGKPQLINNLTPVC